MAVSMAGERAPSTVCSFKIQACQDGKKKRLNKNNVYLLELSTIKTKLSLDNLVLLFLDRSHVSSKQLITFICRQSQKNVNTESYKTSGWRPLHSRNTGKNGSQILVQIQEAE